MIKKSSGRCYEQVDAFGELLRFRPPVRSSDYDPECLRMFLEEFSCNAKDLKR